MKDLLRKLYDSSTQLSLLMIEAKEFAEKYDDKELIEFLEKEINGYKIENGLPDYRTIRATIVCDIKDVYGTIQYTDYPIDFSLLSEKVGFKLDDCYIPDGISFIETSLKSLTKQTAFKPIPIEIVKMLNNVFHYNNNHLNIFQANHKIPTASLEYVLVKSRQILIQRIQKLSRKVSGESQQIGVNKLEDSEKKLTGKKKIFVTYAWDNEENDELVISFVDFLRKDGGFDAFMDRKITQENNSINFNQMMVENLQNSDKVIVVLSKKYKEKADKFEGGVGTEIKIILEDLKLKPNKYIFVHFGKEKREDLTPTGILGVDILNLKDDQENGFNILFSKIKEINVINFSEVNEEEIEVVIKDIRPFKL